MDNVDQQLNSLLGVTLQATIAEIGLVPENYSPVIKDILSQTDIALKLALGCYLDECRKEKDWGSLANLIREMETRGES